MPQTRFIRQVDWAGRGTWVKADTHIHTKFSDGSTRIREVVAKGIEHGCDVLAITDHADRNLTAATPEYAEAIEVARREHPGTVIIAGLEWNLPPWGGDDHAAVLFPPGPNEFLQLAEFKERFDDLDRVPHLAELATEGLRWLAEQQSPSGERPVVIYNHPGRKAPSSLEAMVKMQTWRQVNDLVVGFEGAPGHQAGVTVGAYKSDVKPIDRWDPATAEVGGAWDQLLQQGLDVWGAAATSDFHGPVSGSVGDYWPGQFSETWLYVPERTAEGVLRAFRAGTFIGVHGHIAREVELSVNALGLDRPAIAGEAIAVPVGERLIVQVDCQIPALDWQGKPNRIDRIELIAITNEGASVIAEESLAENGPAYLGDVEVPPGGIVLRARGRRIIDDGPDLMFYTNPIRIMTAEPSWFHLKLPQWSFRQWLGGAVLLLAAGAIAVASISRYRGSARSSDVSHTSVRKAGVPTRGHYALLTVFGMAFIAYCSLVPLKFEPITFAVAWHDFTQEWKHSFILPSRTDFSANVLILVPISFTAMGTLLADRRTKVGMLLAAAGVLPVCLAYSVAVEFAQSWVPPRVPSSWDLIAQAIGAVVGIVAWGLGGQRITDWLRRFSAESAADRQFVWMLEAYAAGLFLYELMPLDLAASPAALYRKWEAGLIALVPFSHWSADAETAWTLLFRILMLLPVGALAVAIGRRRHWPLASCLLLGVVYVFGVEASQLLVLSRYTDTTDVLTGLLGVILGAQLMWAWFHGRRSVAMNPHGETVRTIQWAAGALAWAVFLLAVFWRPFELHHDPELMQRKLAGFLSVPFVKLFWGSELNSITEILRKLLLFGPLGALLFVTGRRVFDRPRLVGWMTVTVCSCLGLLIELVQSLMPDHSPDVTDVMLYTAGGALGSAFARRLLEATPPSSESPDDAPAGSPSNRWLAPVAIGAGGLCLVVVLLTRPPESRVLHSRRSFEDRVGTVFTPHIEEPFAAPQVEQIPVPNFPSGHAIWGATGRDDRGHIWFGVSVEGAAIPSAHLFEYDPDTGEVVDRGNVVDELKRCGVHRAGEGQMKIHSKIIHADDGFLYFASMDEQGENEDGSRLPTWGSHLWRLRLSDYRWEHLHAAPEGLIAVAGTGRWIYALGYFDHVLYQFDTHTERLRWVRVGSVGGHISRNFLTDQRGHVYVPRLRARWPDTAESTHATPTVAVSLVEFDEELRELAETPLENYLSDGQILSHGITGVSPLADGSIVFTTHAGFLYRVVPNESGPAQVQPLDWFHPDERSYAASLFPLDGTRYIAGVAKRPDQPHDWVIFDLQTGYSAAMPFRHNLPPGEPLLYGSATRDDNGGCYVVGVHRDRPLLFRVRPAR